MRLRITAEWAFTSYGSILTWRVVFSRVCFALEFRRILDQSRDSHATTQDLWGPIRHRVRSLFARRWLRESRLFSFPPLSNMLKFSGYSYRTQVSKNSVFEFVFVFRSSSNCCIGCETILTRTFLQLDALIREVDTETPKPRIEPFCKNPTSRNTEKPQETKTRTIIPS